MFDRDFEAFLIKHVRREGTVYFGIMIAIGGCAIACFVMAFAALIRFGLEAVSTSLKLLALGLVFTGSCHGVRSAVLSDRETSLEMADKLENPDCYIPADYSDEAKVARRSACEILKHICGLIISYGILSLTLWAACALFIALAGVGTSDLSLMMLLVAFIMLAMALPLTILTILYMMDLPKALKYKERVNYVLTEERTD